MNPQVLIVSQVGAFLGLISVLLGFSAEATKITASDVQAFPYSCVYPSSPASGLAIGASLLLLVAQIVITAFGGCCGWCPEKPTMPAVTDNKRILAIIFVLISWMTFALSLILFIIGAAKNGRGGRTTDVYDCYVVKPGIFAGGAICALATIFLSIVAYIISSPPTDGASRFIVGVPVVTLQFPPQPQYAASGVNQELMPPGQGGLYTSSGVSEEFANSGQGEFPPQSEYAGSGVVNQESTLPGQGGILCPPADTNNTA